MIAAAGNSRLPGPGRSVCFQTAYHPYGTWGAQFHIVLSAFRFLYFRFCPQVPQIRTTDAHGLLLPLRGFVDEFTAQMCYTCSVIMPVLCMTGRHTPRRRTARRGYTKHFNLFFFCHITFLSAYYFFKKNLSTTTRVFTGSHCGTAVLRRISVSLSSIR